MLTSQHAFQRQRSIRLEPHKVHRHDIESDSTTGYERLISSRVDMRPNFSIKSGLSIITYVTYEPVLNQSDKEEILRIMHKEL